MKPIDRPSTCRSRWAELHVEDVISPSFVAEFVFRSPRVIDRGLEHEVADFLIARGGATLLVSQKCQEDPASRSSEKTCAWAAKSAAKGVAQLRGALRRVGTGQTVWCDHLRRGRVEFAGGLPNISHAIVTVEVFEATELPADLPLEHGGTPITYLSVSDFLNLSQQLRTIPEFVHYLDARLSLHERERRCIGREQELFASYLLGNGSFAGFASHGEAESDRGAQLRDAVEAKAERDRYAGLLEHVADQLAQRHPDFSAGLSTEVLENYEPISERRGYLEMQGIFAEMRLAERAILGKFFDGLIAARRARQTVFGLAAATVDSRPDLVFVFGSFRETAACTRSMLLASFQALCDDAMAHHERTRCLLVVDRDGLSYEVALSTWPPESPWPSPKHQSKIFGPLKTTSIELHFRPMPT